VPEARVEQRVQGSGENQVEVPTLWYPSPLSTRAVKIEPAAWEQWEQYAKATSFDMLPDGGGAVPAKFYASYGRLGTMLIKIATILAAFDAEKLPVTIEDKHVFRAQMICEGWRAKLHSLLDRLSRHTQVTLSDEVLRVLASKGGAWVSRRDLQQALGCKLEELMPVIEQLDGRIERRESQGSRGPKSEEYRLVVPQP
jgi:hypothetical protein